MQSIELSKSSDGTSDVHVLYHRFVKEVELPRLIALANITLYHNWKNISTKFGDFYFSVSIIKRSDEPKRVSDKVVIPDGSYSVTDINNLIHLALNGLEGQTDLFRDFGINLYANRTYNRITIELKPGYGLWMSPDLARLLGSAYYSVVSLDTSTTLNFEYAPSIENVEKIKVHCDLVHNQVQTDSRMLYSFTPKSGIGHLESPKIYFPIWKTTRATKVDEIRVWLTNQLDEPLDFEDEWSVTILLNDDNNEK